MTTNNNELKEKFLTQLDFLSDHWVKGDDRPPFSFGGWRDEVAEAFVEIVAQDRKERNEELRKKIEERIGVLTNGSGTTQKEYGDIGADAQHREVVSLRWSLSLISE